MTYKIVYLHQEDKTERPLWIAGDQEYILTSCRLDVECGKSGTLTMGVPEENPAKYDLIFPTDEVVVYRDEKEIWRGRPVTEARDFYNTGTLTCEGILSYLYDAYFPPFEFEGSPKEFLQMVLDYYNSYVDEWKQFELGDITVVDNNDYINRSSIYYDRCLTVLTEKLINDSLGGYFRIRVENGHRYLDYLETYATEASQAVEYGENLLDIAQEIEYTDVASVILPLGARLEDEDGIQTDEYTTIASVNGGSVYYVDEAAVERYGWICVCNEWEDVTLPENLLERAKTYLEQVTNAIATMTVNAVDMALISDDVEAINLGDYVYIRSLPHGISQYVELTAMTIYPMSPEDNVLTFGSSTSSLTDSQRNSDRNVQSALGSLSMRVTNLTATVIDAVYANIETIIANTITTEYIRAAVADLGYVTADYLEAYYMTADMIEANYLSVNSAVITDLTAFEANITALLAGEAGVGSLQAIHLTSDNVVIDDAVIESILASNAIIATLIAGDIYTDYIKIANNEGENLLIDGATIQINDGTVVRIQMGLDASGNYNFYIWNEDGDVIWDALGLTEAGLIGNGAIIRDIAVADDANISGYKLNIAEVAEILNADGSLVLNAAQVTIDGETLDYRLTQMTEAIEGISFEGLVTFVTYFCLWPSATEPPCEETDFTPSLTDEAETDYCYTDLYDYDEIWSTTEPAQTDGLYKWVRYLLYYEDGHTEWSDPYCITDDFIREQTTVLQTQLEVVQGQISAKIWMSDITEAVETTITDYWAQIIIWQGEIESQVGQMSTTMDSLSAQVATQDITIEGITDTVYQIQAEIEGLDLTGVETFVTYFCEWYSPTDPPVDEADFTPALTDEAETDYCFTDLYDFYDIWTTDEPTVADGNYKWVRYLLYYQDGHTEWTTPYCVSDDYARTQVSGAYSRIEQLANSINLSVTGVLGGTAVIKLTVDEAEIEQDLDLSAVRQAFADDNSEVMISAGLINFASNTIVINSDNLSVTQDGSIYATNAYLEGEVVTQSGDYRSQLYAGTLQFWHYDNSIAKFVKRGSFTTSVSVENPDQIGISLFADKESDYMSFSYDENGDEEYYNIYFQILFGSQASSGYSERFLFYADMRITQQLAVMGNISCGWDISCSDNIYVGYNVYSNNNVYPYNVWFENNQGILSYTSSGGTAWLMWLNGSNWLNIGSTGNGINGIYLNSTGGTVYRTLSNGYAYNVPCVNYTTFSITPSAANTPTSTVITFTYALPSTPYCFANPNTSVPGTAVTGVACASPSTTGCTVWLTRTNTTATQVQFMAFSP